MKTALTICPHCGEGSPGYYPNCPFCTNATPVFVEMNALSRLVCGTDTFVEFRLINPDERPVRVEALNVTLDETLPLTPRSGEALEEEIPPGGFRLVDFVIPACNHHLPEGSHTLRLELTVRGGGGAFVFSSTAKAHAEEDLSQELPIFHPLSQDLQRLAPEALQQGLPPAENSNAPWLLLSGIQGWEPGEAQGSGPVSARIAEEKRTHGCWFIPLHLRPVHAGADAVTPRQAGCVDCGRESQEGGAYCPWCGVEQVEALPPSPPPESDTAAYCNTCFPERRLRAMYPHCPDCGTSLPVHLQVSELDFYLEGVRARVGFQLRSVHPEPVKLISFDATFDDQPLKKGHRRIFGNPKLRPGAEPVMLDRLLQPPEQSARGDGVLSIELTYESDGRRYTLQGHHAIKVFPYAEDPQTIINQIQPEIGNHGEGRNFIADDIIINVQTEGKISSAKELFDALMNAKHDTFRPVLMNAQCEALRYEITSPESGTLLSAGGQCAITWESNAAPGASVSLNLLRDEQDADAIAGKVMGNSYDWNVPLDLEPGTEFQVAVAPDAEPRCRALSPAFAIAPAITWAPANRATLWFKHEDIRHAYCIHSTYDTRAARPGVVRFGRNGADMDLRLLDIERYFARKADPEQCEKARQRKLSLSRVSVAQWEIALANSHHKGAGITVKHLGGGTYTQLDEDERVLHRGESTQLLPKSGVVACQENAFPAQIVGLEYAALSEMGGPCHEARNKGRQILDSLGNPPEPQGGFPGKLASVRLNRRYSLTGKSIGGYERYQAMEAYVLMPTAATIGSSPSACIHVPHGNCAPIHAWLLHVDGYLFLTPHDGAAVSVNGVPVPGDIPWPLEPGNAQIQVGDATLWLEEFWQLFISEKRIRK